MRPLLIPAVALLAVALTAPARAPEPLIARTVPRLEGIQVVRTRDALGASWRPVAGQALVCGVRVRPLPQQPLEPCLRGTARSSDPPGPRDINLQVWPGDVVEFRVYRDDGALIAVGQRTVDSSWRAYLPSVYGPVHKR